MKRAQEMLPKEIDVLRSALLDLVLAAETGALVSTRISGSAALQRASRILGRNGFAPYSYECDGAP